MKNTHELRMADEHRHIDRWCPEVKKGGLRVLDIGCGCGEFIDLCRDYNCEAIGIDHQERGVSGIIMADFKDVINCGGKYPELDREFDLINCKYTINGIYNKHLKPKKTYEISDWTFSAEMETDFGLFFEWIHSHLVDSGTFVLFANSCMDEARYSQFVVLSAGLAGFKLLDTDRHIIHKFGKA